MARNQDRSQKKTTVTQKKPARGRPRVFLELRAAEDKAAGGRVEVELAWETCPLTAEHFRVQCTGEKGPKYHLKGKPFTKIIPGFMMQGVQGVCSIYGGAWEEENFTLKHTEAGV